MPLALSLYEDDRPRRGASLPHRGCIPHYGGGRHHGWSTAVAGTHDGCATGQLGSLPLLLGEGTRYIGDGAGICPILCNRMSKPLALLPYRVTCPFCPCGVPWRIRFL